MRLFVTLILALAGCVLEGNGQRVEVERQVASFDAIEVFGDFKVEVQVRPELGEVDTITVRVSGDANAIDRLFTGVHGEEAPGTGTLTIALDPSLQTELALVPTVTFEIPALGTVFTSDQARVDLHGGDGQLSLEAGSESTIVARALTDCSATAVARARGSITLIGSGPQLRIEASEQARVIASAFRADTAAVTVSGEAAVLVCSLSAPAITGPSDQVTLTCAE